MVEIIKKNIIFYSFCFLCIILSISPVRADLILENQVKGHFAPELTPGSNFTWKVNEWYNMTGWLNSGSNYVPKPGDLWTMTIIGDLPTIPLNSTCNWNISEWNVDNFNFPSMNAIQFNISGHGFFEVFGNESDNGYNWKMVNRLFLLPYTVEYEDGSTENFGKFCEASFGGIEIEVEVNVGSDPDLKVQGTIGGEDENTSVYFEATLGVDESFVYTKHSVTTTLRTAEGNISLIHREFFPRYKPVIPGYSLILSVSVIFIGVITVLIQHQITNTKHEISGSRSSP